MTPEITKTITPDTAPFKGVRRLASLFASPGTLMDNIRAYPKAGLPLLICILISLATLPLSMRVAEIQTRRMSLISLERYGVDYFNMTAQLDEDGMPVTAINSATMITTAIGLIVAYPATAAISALLLLILCKIMRGPAKFPHYFSLYAHTGVIGALCGVITMTVCVVFDNTLDVLSLAAVLMPGGDNADFVFNLLSAISLPAVWTGALTIIGLKAVNEWSTVKAAVAGAIAFICSVGFAAGSLGMSFYMFDLFDRALTL